MEYYNRFNDTWSNNGWTTSPPKTCQDKDGYHNRMLDPITGETYCGVCLTWLSKDPYAAQSAEATTSNNSTPSADGTASIVDTTGYAASYPFWGGLEF